MADTDGQLAFSMPSPTIKGVFVLSHINAVRRAQGSAGVRLLRERYGKSLAFGPFDDVPVREEVRLIELALDIIEPHPDRTRQEHEFEAGRLHFKNFSQTLWGKSVFRIFGKDLRYHMLNASVIAERVFSGVGFRSLDTGERSVSVFITNQDYPGEHFRGLFQGWMEYLNYRGSVSVVHTEPNEYRYDFVWD